MNKHITENIQYYLSLDKPEYALLLSGKWGSGKTHFINNFVGNISDDKRKKFILISLFGLKNVESIDEQIFQNLHPFLGSKYAKLAGNIAKSAFKIGINLDWNGDEKNDGSVSTDLKSFNLLDFFSNKKKTNKEIIFIFDDLERTEISLQEILGYINYLIEISSFKVIIIANEEKLLEKDSEKIYKDFKEKVIGKTFEVRHDFSEILNSFLSHSPIDIPNFDKQIIKEIYGRAGYNNLRHIKQSIIDFRYLTEKINAEFLSSDEFLIQFTYVFFVLSVEVKQGALDEKNFMNYSSLMKNISQNGKKEEESVVDRILKKYSLNSQFLLARDVWCKIIYRSYIDESELNSSIKNLPFFVEKKERPSWVKLWHYRELDDTEFSENLKDVIQKFKTYSYEIPEIYLHATALLIFFHKNNLSEFSVDEIKNYVNEYSDMSFKSEHRNHSILRNDILFNGTGLGYMGENDPDFRELFKIIKIKNEEMHTKHQKTKINDDLRLFVEAIKNYNKDCIYNYLLDIYRWVPVLENLDPSIFFDALIGGSNKAISDLIGVFSSRYSENHTYNGHSCYYVLSGELNFWKKIKEKIISCDKFSLKSFLIKEFEKYIIDKNIKMMDEEINKRNGCITTA